MSSSSRNRSNQGNNNRRGPPSKPQQNYVRKTAPTAAAAAPTTSATAPTATKTLSNSLRQASASGAAVGGSRVNSGGNFVNYLPQDEAVASGLGGDDGGLDSVESQQVVDLLNKEMSRLLRLKPGDFWKEVASDTSLHACLDSFLKYKSRWYDFPYRAGSKGIATGGIVGESELCRRVFMVLYRISSNRDPNAKVDSLSQKDHTACLQEKKLLDLPKLLDICALYGHENEDLTRSLVENAIKAQPWLHDEFTAIASHFLSIVHTMYQRCTSSLEVLFTTANLQDEAVSQLRSDYLEVMDFINDAVVNLDAFVAAYNHAAVFFCSVEIRNEELLATLAKLHDTLLPSLQRGLQIVIGSRGVALQDDLVSDVFTSVRLLSSRIINFGGKLLDICYLGEEAFQIAFPDSMSNMMFPANVDEPMIRTEILVQKLREISQQYSDASEGDSRGSFLQNIEKHHQIISRIEFLQSAGWLSIDDDQKQLLSGILGHPFGLKSLDKSHTASQLTADWSNGGENAAFFESEISQIKDLFPEYGKGFLAACLEVYNHSAEEVIQRILDGTLHEDLQTMDTSLEQMPRKNLSASASGKGKGKLVDQVLSYPLSSSSSAGISVHQPADQPRAYKSPPAVGRFTRKAKGRALDEENLDVKDDLFASKNSAIILQMEYEDEYDDSFDELGLSVGDSGMGDSELFGNKQASHPARQASRPARQASQPARQASHPAGRSSEAGSSGSASSRWSSDSKKPMYYVKDGKNYSYEVPGAVAVNNYNEAAVISHTQADNVNGLGRGGNVPFHAGRRGTEAHRGTVAEPRAEADVAAVGRGNFRGRGRGRGRGRWTEAAQEGNAEPEFDHEHEHDEHEPDEHEHEHEPEEGGGARGGRGGRGKGRGGGGGRHHRKNLAAKKYNYGVIG